MINEVWTVVDIIHNDEEYKKSTLDQRTSSTWNNELEFFFTLIFYYLDDFIFGAKQFMLD